MAGARVLLLLAVSYLLGICIASIPFRKAGDIPGSIFKNLHSLSRTTDLIEWPWVVDNSQNVHAGPKKWDATPFQQGDPNCPPHPVPVPLPSTLPDVIQTALGKLGNILQKQVNTVSVPGVAGSVVYRDQVVWSEGFGVKSKETPSVKPDQNSIFRIGSVSKVFATLMLYQLYDHGMVKSLDDPLATYCPGFSINNPYSGSQITLRQMAAQMSGLPREAPCVTATRSNTTNICPVDTSTIIQRLKNQSLIFPPYTVPSYSNLAYALLGRCLVEHFFPGTSYEEYVMKNILAPLEMKNTGFNITSSVMSQMAVGYEPDGSVAPLYDLGWEGPAGQMYSTTSDLNKLAQFFYSVTGVNVSSSRAQPASDILSPDLIREMELQVYVNRDLRTGFGTPWEIRFESNYTILRKGGNVDGYSALFSYVPELKLGLNVLFSGSADEFSVSNAAHEVLIPAFVAALLPLQSPFPYPPDPKVYEGNYSAHIRGQIIPAVVFTSNKQLLYTANGQTAYLAYIEPLKLQIDYSDTALPCLLGELTASRREWVEFEPKDQSGVSTGFTIPGLLPGARFARIK